MAEAGTLVAEALRAARAEGKKLTPLGLRSAVGDRIYLDQLGDTFAVRWIGSDQVVLPIKSRRKMSRRDVESLARITPRRSLGIQSWGA